MRHETMHVDDLWSAGLKKPDSPRGLGTVIQEARRREWIEHIKANGGVVARPSVRSNLQLKAVWRSRIYRGG